MSTTAVGSFLLKAVFCIYLLREITNIHHAYRIFILNFVSCGIELLSLGQTGVAMSFHHELILSFSCAVTAAALLPMCILQYGFILWVLGHPWLFWIAIIPGQIALLSSHWRNVPALEWCLEPARGSWESLPKNDKQSNLVILCWPLHSLELLPWSLFNLEC